MNNGRPAFTAPVFLASAFFIFGLALVEKFLNLLGTGLPLGVDVGELGRREPPRLAGRRHHCLVSREVVADTR